MVEGVRARTIPGRFFLAASRDEGSVLPDRARALAFGYELWQWALIDEENPNLVAAAPPVCEDIVRFHPALWHGHECLGRASLQIGDLQKAARAFQDALRLAKRAHDAEGIKRAQEGLRAIARGR